MSIKIFLSIVIIVMTGFFQAHEKGAPKISFEKTTADFGVFTEKSPKHKAVFKFTNTGDKPLIIIRVRASCGCTTPTFSKAPIMPGKNGTVTVEYDGTNRAPGFFQKSINVYTNDSIGMVRLYIKGEMKRESKQ